MLSLIRCGINMNMMWMRFFIGNSSINWDVTESLDTLTYVTLDKNFIDEEVRKCNAYSVYDSDSIKQFSEQLINTLVGYDNYPTL